MTISYKWLCEYLPGELTRQGGELDVEKVASILTSIGLEVEGVEKYEEIKGGLKGLITGEVLTCVKHPDADKLKITTVSVGKEKPLQIICGANNVAAGQKVVIAPLNATIYPVAGNPVLIKNAKIRGIESEGMICAEDEIGLGNDHAGIMVLPPDTIIGTPVEKLFNNYSDHIYEIGLTPNRIDAMSHIGVAKDICAWLSHHFKKDYKVAFPYPSSFAADTMNDVISVEIADKKACKRYSGISIRDISVKASPDWLQQRLKSIGVKPINNIVDITNFILHETGQPMHAFDADQIKGNKIIVKPLPEGTLFTTLDDKERKLSAADLMICNAEEPMCIAGVYGGVKSGVTEKTKNIFLESAWFDPSHIRKTSLRHGLRTDAASRFEKGTDISNTLPVLKRAANMIRELTGGKIAGEIIDVYPEPLPKANIGLKYHYLKKLSGKSYHGEAVKNILTALGFAVIKEGTDEIRVDVPYSKPDVTIQADLVEEIMRIDGLDNIEIPETISISPAIDKYADKSALKEKIAAYLTSSGYFEIFTNSISNSRLYDAEVLKTSVKMINSLSSELDIMRPDMLQSGLQAIAYNLNRKNEDLRFYEFGRTYAALDGYKETPHLSIYVSGNLNQPDWKNKPAKTDFFLMKGIAERILRIAGYSDLNYSVINNRQFGSGLSIHSGGKELGMMGEVSREMLKKHDIKQSVYFADMLWDVITSVEKTETFREISKFPAAQRDLAIVLDKGVPFAAIQKATELADIPHLTAVELFDVFESEKLGPEKKSMAINYTFSDDTRTLTDKDIDAMMNKLIGSYEKELKAEIRK